MGDFYRSRDLSHERGVFSWLQRDPMFTVLVRLFISVLLNHCCVDKNSPGHTSTPFWGHWAWNYEREQNYHCIIRNFRNFRCRSVRSATSHSKILDPPTENPSETIFFCLLAIVVRHEQCTQSQDNVQQAENGFIILSYNVSGNALMITFQVISAQT